MKISKSKIASTNFCIPFFCKSKMTENHNNRSYTIQKFINTEHLQELGQLFRTALGRNGNFKMFETSVGHVTITRFSGRMVPFLMKIISDPCAEAILHVLKSHLEQYWDFGLSLGSLCCDLTLTDRFW